MSVLHHHYQANRRAQPQKVYTGLDRLIDTWIGRTHQRSSQSKAWRYQAEEILDYADRLTKLSSRDLQKRLQHQRETIRKKQSLPQSDHIETFALLVEAATRTLALRPYAVQIMGAIALVQGYLVEMATGEGKTLTAALATTISGWTGQPCHLVTANDYLAARDAQNLQPFYQYCGVTVGRIEASMTEHQRRQQYSHGIVYLTGKELLADFLRDQLAIAIYPDAPQRQIQEHLNNKRYTNRTPVMRGISRVIVDEADSVMIDEAVTPLIISQTQPVPGLKQACQQAQQLAERLVKGRDYTTDQRRREVYLTRAGERLIKQWDKHLPHQYKAYTQRMELLITALTAQEFFREECEYLIEDDQVVIVDEFTGRMMPNRTWRLGLQQAIEARENLPLTDPSETLAQLSFQNFFRFFNHLSGLTGTARETSSEFWSIYRLPVISIPSHRPCQRIKYPQLFYAHAQDKWNAICDEIIQCHSLNQPLLVGTRSIAASENLAKRLTDRKIDYRLLNAARHKEEAEIIASAGTSGQVTIATNMAGRGSDITLKGEVAMTAGLRIIVTEPHESKRIDRQLEGRCARQGQPGQTRVYASLEDALLVKYLPKIVSRCIKRLIYLRAANRFITTGLVQLTQYLAQKDAEKARKKILLKDKQLDESLSFHNRSH